MRALYPTVGTFVPPCRELSRIDKRHGEREKEPIRVKVTRGTLRRVSIMAMYE